MTTRKYQNPSTKGFYLLIIAMIISSIFFSPTLMATPIEDGDYGFWSQNDIEKKLNDQWKIKFGDELRFREHSGLIHEEIRAGASFQAFSWVTLSADYLQTRQIRTKGKKDIWYWTSEPRVYFTLQQKLKGFLLEDRNMLEFRMKQHTDDTLRYRNQVGLTAPWKWTRLEFQPYVTNEIFIETERKGVTEDRLSPGLKMHWWGPVYGSIFYLLKSTKDSQGKWKNLNNFGTGIKISF